MALTAAEEAAVRQLLTASGLDGNARAAADLTTMKNTAEQIVAQTKALVKQATDTAAAYPVFAPEVNAAKAAFIAALKAALA